MDFGECVGKPSVDDLPEVPKTRLIVVICRVPNSNNDQTSSMQLQHLYADGRHSEEPMDIIEKYCGSKVPYYLIAIYTCNLMQEELGEEYMG
jgi:hypothetical protein